MHAAQYFDWVKLQWRSRLRELTKARVTIAGREHPKGMTQARTPQLLQSHTRSTRIKHRID